MKQDVQFFESTAVPRRPDRPDRHQLEHDRQDRHRARRRRGLSEDAARRRSRRGRRLRRLRHRSSSRSRPIARCSSRAVREHGRARLDVAEQRRLRLAEAVRPGARQDGNDVRRQAIVVLSDGEDTSSLVQRRRCARAGAADGREHLHGRPAVEATRGARSRTPLLLRVGLRDEDARARDRRAVVLPGAGAS